MSTEPAPTLAERMYPSMAAASAIPTGPGAAGAPTPAEGQGETAAGAGPTSDGAASGEPAALSVPAAPAHGQQISVDDLVNEPASLEERTQAFAAVTPEGPDGYQHPLGEGFDELLQQAREAGDSESAAALMEGRAEAAVVFSDMQVSTADAKQIVHALGDWHRRGPLSDEHLEASRGRAERELRKEWGPSYDARVQLAQQAAKQAMSRLPWLAELMEDGAGNDPALIRHFAQIGLRGARRRKP